MLVYIFIPGASGCDSSIYQTGQFHGTIHNPGNSPLSISENPYSYSHYYRDSETGFNYCKARYYSPGTGSFTTRDTFDLANRFMYCSGNPVSNTDPSWHKLEDYNIAGISLGSICAVTLIVGIIILRRCDSLYEYKLNLQTSKIEPELRPKCSTSFIMHPHTGNALLWTSLGSGIMMATALGIHGAQSGAQPNPAPAPSPVPTDEYRCVPTRA